MPFEPRIIREDPHERSSPLPDDLAALGDQLTADSRWLARLFPPTDLRASSIDVRRRVPTWLKMASAAAVLVMAVALSWQGWRVGDAPSIGQDVARIAGAGVIRPQASRPPLPVASFMDLSGPEQEAVLDLWETHTAEPYCLSI